MFEQFTEGARRVVVRAQESARVRGRPDIGTGELLLALAGADGQEAAAALYGQGITPQRLEVESLARQPPGRRLPAGHIPFSVRVQRALERAGVHAVNAERGDDPPLEAYGEPAAGTPAAPQAGAASGSRPGEVLRPGHLLLGLLDDAECTAFRVLTGLGADPVALRLDVHRLPGHGPWASAAGGAPSDVRVRPGSRHRPAGTSRFPPPVPDDEVLSGTTVPQPEPMWPESDLLAPGAARAAWAQLQRRQARLPVSWMRTRSGWYAVQRNEARAVHRLALRLGLDQHEERRLRTRHQLVLDEIASRTGADRSGRLSPGPYRRPTTLAEALRRRRPAVAMTKWAAAGRSRKRWTFRHLGGWLVWLGNRRVDAIALWLRATHQP